ncbi:hypothetical protein JB92DRAFT_3100083 [Gautieria morchelliformis]|nr:hypothetical protein JB92DRAFT_3100083 [Gautieria morchelliformis]
MAIHFRNRPVPIHPQMFHPPFRASVSLYDPASPLAVFSGVPPAPSAKSQIQPLPSPIPSTNPKPLKTVTTPPGASLTNHSATLLAVAPKALAQSNKILSNGALGLISPKLFANSSPAVDDLADIPPPQTTVTPPQLPCPPRRRPGSAMTLTEVIERGEVDEAAQFHAGQAETSSLACDSGAGTFHARRRLEIVRALRGDGRGSFKDVDVRKLLFRATYPGRSSSKSTPRACSNSSARPRRSWACSGLQRLARVRPALEPRTRVAKWQTLLHDPALWRGNTLALTRDGSLSAHSHTLTKIRDVTSLPVEPTARESVLVKSGRESMQDNAESKAQVSAEKDNARTSSNDMLRVVEGRDTYVAWGAEEPAEIHGGNYRVVNAAQRGVSKFYGAKHHLATSQSKNSQAPHQVLRLLDRWSLFAVPAVGFRQGFVHPMPVVDITCWRSSSMGLTLG